MNKKRHEHDLVHRLEEVENSLRDIKLMLAAIIVLLLIGFFGVSSIMGATITALFTAAVIGLALYAIVWLAWGLMKWRNPRPNDAELEKELLAEMPGMNKKTDDNQ